MQAPSDGVSFSPAVSQKPPIGKPSGFRQGGLWLCALLLLAACDCTGGSNGQRVRLQGAGASFPAPLYLRWFRTYSQAHEGVVVDYQSIGSGSGVKAVIDGTVDFGASDAAMSELEMARVERGVQLLPLTAGSVVLTYNLEGIQDLRLPRAVYPQIFLGKVTRWNDPQIVAANPGKKLPDTPIHVVVRADSSGTSYVFTKHLAAINPEFAKAPGAQKMPNWPVGTRAKGNEGVTASIETTPGAIGYIEYTFAHTQNLPMVLLENRSGAFVKPGPASGLAALAKAELPENLIVWMSDPEGPGAYPIVTYTWLILYRTYDNPRVVAVLKDLVGYAIGEGQTLSKQLGYIPLPDNVVARVRSALDNVQAKATAEP